MGGSKGLALFDEERSQNRDIDIVTLTEENQKKLVDHYHARLTEAAQKIPSLTKALSRQKEIRIIAIGCGANPIDLPALTAFLKENNCDAIIQRIQAKKYGGGII